MSAKAVNPSSRYKSKQDDTPHLWFSSDLVDDDIPDDYKMGGSNLNESGMRRPHEYQFRWSQEKGENDHQEAPGGKKTILTVKCAFLVLSLCLLIAGSVGIVVYTTRSIKEHQQILASSSTMKALASEPYNFSDVIYNNKGPDSIIMECFRTLNEAPVNNNFVDDTVPFFWDIPLSGGTFLPQVLQCLSVNFITFNPMTMNVNFPKVRDHSFSDDTVLITPMIYDTCTKLSQAKVKGKLFAVFRHPVDRILSMTSGIQSIQQKSWIQSSQSNYMTRVLADATSEQELTELHLKAAMNILDQSCFVGLYNDLYASVSMFERYFHWLNDTSSIENQPNATCVKEALRDIPRPNVALESEAARTIKEQNLWDIKLYQFVQELYRRQKSQSA